MRKVATAAEATPWPEQRKSLKGLEWMPPSLDSGTAEELVEAVAATSPTDLPLPSEARLLSSQMAAMTERISSLETVVRNQDRELHHHGRDLHAVEREVVSSSSSWWWPLSYFWPSNTSHSSSTAADSNHKHSKSDVKVQSKRTNRRRTDEMQTAIVRQVVASVGGVASVAAFVAWLYTRRRR